MIKKGVQLRSRFGEQSMLHRHPFAPEFLKRTTGVARVRIRRRDDHSANPRINDGLRARRRAAVGRAWFQSDKQRGAACCVAVFHGILDGVHLGVRQPARRCQPRPMILPRRTRTAPTIGLGDVSPLARLARRSASRIHCSSVLKVGQRTRLFVPRRSFNARLATRTMYLFGWPTSACFNSGIASRDCSSISSSTIAA